MFIISYFTGFFKGNFTQNAQLINEGKIAILHIKLISIAKKCNNVV